MDFRITLSYQHHLGMPGEVQTWSNAKINHIRSGDARRGLQREKKLASDILTEHERKRLQKKRIEPAFVATVVSFIKNDRIITAISKLNPKDDSFSKRAGIIGAIVNYITKTLPDNGSLRDKVVLIKADRIITDEFDGYDLEFTTEVNSQAEGYLYENYWWIKKKTCPMVEEQEIPTVTE